MTWNPFGEEHDLFRQQVRTFAEKELAPRVDKWEEDGIFPNEVFKWAGDRGITGAHYPEEVGGGGGDYWMSIVKAEELARSGAAGVTMGLLVQSDMATPIINDIGTDEQKEEFLKPALAGDKIAALGVSEPGAGSDVAGLRTTARRDGDDYVINGSKTYITNGTRADFVTCMVKTDPDAGARGVSTILIPTDVKGYSVSKKLEKAGNWSSDTAELFFEDVRVPARYLLGQEGMGFIYLMQNFQSERLVGCASGLAGARLALDRSVEFGPRAEGVRQAAHQARVLAAEIRRALYQGRGGTGAHLQGRRRLQRREIRPKDDALDGDDQARVHGQGLRRRRERGGHGPMPAVPRWHGLPRGALGRARVA